MTVVHGNKSKKRRHQKNKVEIQQTSGTCDDISREGTKLTKQQKRDLKRKMKTAIDARDMQKGNSPFGGGNTNIKNSTLSVYKR